MVGGRTTFGPGIFEISSAEKARERAEYEERRKAEAIRQGLVGPDGQPLSADEIARRGMTPETRDFTSTYNKFYKKPHIEVCPVTRLPPVPPLKYPQAHAFWDAATQRWY
eukprot:Gregarina_sp_Poly_1__1057@NODE_125_length_13444_cov_91_472378_g111_i0_p15_GENE_NODE_125_length_13444_cov_91_472378_g111_i0NODE_125_length_13444_cov_91_472378_g111_i0_p15_ORF_typecomplete_len110_score7_19_NODE_125_length_13444_cov_91_472378_g111_i0118447